MKSSGYEVVFENFLFLPDKKKVLEIPELCIKSGEFVSIVGNNGAGKSSLLKAIAGELNRKLVKGNVFVAGEPILNPINSIINRVGIVHQFDDSDLILHLAIEQNIAIRQIFGGGHPNKIFASTTDWQRDMKAILGSIPGFNKRFFFHDYVKSLSGGERQFLNVVIAIHIENKQNPCCLLLLDEHTSRLSTKWAKSIMNFVKNEVQQYNITTIMVSHRFSDAIEFSDKIIILEDGKLKKNLNIKEKPITVAELTDLVEN